MDILELEQKSSNNDKFDENGSKNNENIQKNRKMHKIIVGLGVSTAILAVGASTFLGLWISSENKQEEYKNNLENIYESNFYSMLDNVNNLENKISKTLNSSSSTYQRKTLLEASKNASESEIAVASLPLSQNDIQDTIKMVNQISGYTSTLAEKLVDDKLDEDDYQTLQSVHESVLNLKKQLNEFERKLNRGYSIIEASGSGDDNNFSLTLSSFKDNDVEYPAMIYDGPFSDSVTTKAVKGLKGENVTKSQAILNIEKRLKNASSVEYESETNGNFETYNFRVTNTENEVLFVQVTKVGGYILTISGAGDKTASEISESQAEDIALDFVSENGIKNAQIVWSDRIQNDVYFNITPVSNGIILYPDLVKVKISLASGTVTGYDATSYYTNHVDRSLSKGSVKTSEVSGKIPSYFDLVQDRIVLSPLDYNREVVCIEIEARDNDDTYYFYFNVDSGELENVLKVIKTDNGNLLM